MGINEPYTSIGQNGLVKFFRKELLLKQILLLNRSRVLAITTFESLVHMKEIYIFCPTTEIRASKLVLNGIERWDGHLQNLDICVLQCIDTCVTHSKCLGPQVDSVVSR